MKFPYVAIALAFAMLALTTSGALALSTEEGSPSKSSNPSDFTDPDEHQPAFGVSSDGQSSGRQTSSPGSAPVTFDLNPATGRSREDNSDAFNRAFSNK